MYILLVVDFVTNESFFPVLADDQEIKLPISDVLNHIRWDRCGLLSANNILLEDFNSKYGLVSLRSLVGFMKRYNFLRVNLIDVFTNHI